MYVVTKYQPVNYSVEWDILRRLAGQFECDNARAMTGTRAFSRQT